MTKSDKGGQNVPLFDDITFEKAQQKDEGRRSVSFLLGNHHQHDDKQKESKDDEEGGVGGHGAIARQVCQFWHSEESALCS